MTEFFEQKSTDIKEVDWVQSQIKAELSSLQKELFYTKENDTVTYNMETVKSYLNSLKDKKRSELNSKNSSAWMMAVQIGLEKLGYDTGKVDGLFGGSTKEAVKKFQSENELEADAAPGSATIKKLLEKLGAKETGSNAKETGSNAKETGSNAKETGSNAKETLTEVPKVDFSTLGTWKNNEFVFKDGVLKSDEQGNYIELAAKKYHERKTGMNGLGFEKGINNADIGWIFLGDFKDGNSHGKGVVTWVDGEKHEGDFKDGNSHGKGVTTWADGDKYDGDFKDGHSHGKGVYSYVNGDKYDGDFKDDKRNGKGVETLSDGTEYNGEWKDDERNGKGKETYDNGKKSVGGYYEDGKELFGGFSTEKDTKKDHSKLRGEMKLKEDGNTKETEVTSRGNTIRLKETNQGYLFETKSNAKLTLPKSLGRKGVLNAANLINAAVSAVKNSSYELDKFEAQFGTLQADYKKYPLDIDIITDVQGKFGVSAKVLVDRMNEYRKDAGI